MKRNIIRIDADVCNGCGQCLPNCPEGALQLIDGKARLVSDLFCDGLGACIGTCPLGAIHVEEREAAPYDENQVMANIVTQGDNVIRAHLDHLAAHNETTYLEQAQQFLREHGMPLPESKKAKSPEFHGCPGSQMHDRREKEAAAHSGPAASASALRTWPVQLQLLNPQASFFDNADLLIAADCVPFAHAAFHEDFVKGKIPVIFCPKLDHVGDQYLDGSGTWFKLYSPYATSAVVHPAPGMTHTAGNSLGGRPAVALGAPTEPAEAVLAQGTLAQVQSDERVIEVYLGR